MITFLLIEKGKITMLFNNKELQSNFDIGKDLPDEQANINCLAEEIIRITEKIYNIEGKLFVDIGIKIIGKFLLIEYVLMKLLGIEEKKK